MLNDVMFVGCDNISFDQMMDEFVKRHKALHAQLNDKTKFYRLNREEVEDVKVQQYDTNEEAQ